MGSVRVAKGVWDVDLDHHGFSVSERVELAGVGILELFVGVVHAYQKAVYTLHEGAIKVVSSLVVLSKQIEKSSQPFYTTVGGLVSEPVTNFLADGAKAGQNMLHFGVALHLGEIKRDWVLVVDEQAE